MRSTEPVRVGSTLLSLTPRSMVSASLPDEAARQGLSGPVLLEIRIDEQGTVTVLSVVRGHPLLNERAKTAVGKWKYDPVWMKGHGIIPVITVVAVPFQK